MSRRLALRAVAPAEHHRGRAGRRRAACAARPDGRHRANCAAHSPHLAGPDALSSCAQGAPGSAEGEDLGMIEAEYGEWLALANLLRKTAPAEAVTYFQRAAALDPRNAIAREGLALSLLASGDPGAFSQLAALVTT